MAESNSRVSSLAKKIVPIIISLLILYYYFHEMDWLEFWYACAEANLWIAVSALVIQQLIFWFFEVLIVERHLRWFHGPFSFKTYFWVRGALYLLMFINLALGGGGQIVYIKRKTRIAWRKFTGLILFRIGLTLWGLGILMIPLTIAMQRYVPIESLKININIWWGLLIILAVTLLIAWSFWHHNRFPRLSKLVVRNRGSEFWTVFNAASRSQWLCTWAMALPPFIFMILAFYFVTIAFGIKVPLLEFLVTVPLAIIIMELPIAFAGIGTATLGWMTFYGDYGTLTQIGAATLFLPVVRSLIRATIGIGSLPPALNDIQSLMKPASDEPMETACG